jgi:hypothetical protein
MHQRPGPVRDRSPTTFVWCDSVGCIPRMHQWCGPVGDRSPTTLCLVRFGRVHSPNAPTARPGRGPCPTTFVWFDSVGCVPRTHQWCGPVRDRSPTTLCLVRFCRVRSPNAPTARPGQGPEPYILCVMRFCRVRSPNAPMVRPGQGPEPYNFCLV